VTRFSATITDKTGVPIWGKGYGDYIEAPDAATARQLADREFRQPLPTPKDDDALGAKFLASVRAKFEAAVRDGYTITVRKVR
jgi:hypothetical protein